MKPNSIIMLDKPRPLRLSIKTMIDFEGITGISLLKRFDLSVFSVTSLLWVMLKADDPNLTLDDTIELIEKSKLTLNKVAEQVMKIVVDQTVGEKESPNVETPTAEK